MINYVKEHKTELISISVVTVFAYILRIIALHNFGEFWIDEMFSSYFAEKQNVFEIIKSLFVEDFHVPLYFICLHLWMKLFGNSECIMRLMGLLISTLTVPAVYFIVKDLFKSSFSALTAALFVAVSAFNIHYCVELRFYGMSILFALLATYFYVKLIQDFNRKNIVSYIVSALLLLYTYNFAFMYIFCQFITAFVYSIVKDKKHFKTLLAIYFVIGLFYLPILFMIFINILKYKSSILNFVRDVFYFDISWFSTYFITVFSNLYDQFILNNPILNTYYLKNMFKPDMLFGVFIPVIFGLVGLAKGLTKTSLKNKNLFFLIIPALLLLVIQIILVFSHILALIYRYTIITTTLLLIVAVLGYANDKKHVKICVSCLFIWLTLNISSYFYITKNHPVLNRHITYTVNLEKRVDELHLNDNDIILIPSFEKLFSKQIKHGTYFDIDLYDALYIGTRPQDVEFVFGKDLTQRLNRKNAKTYLQKYIVFDEPLYEMKKNMNEQIFKKMYKGQRFIIVTDEDLSVLKYNQQFLHNIEAYKLSAIGDTLEAKIITDMIRFASEKLTLKKHIKVSEMFNIYVFEKE